MATQDDMQRGPDWAPLHSFALLAPDITEAILEGTQPIDLNLDRLINLSLPIDWAEQRSVLGFK